MPLHISTSLARPASSSTFYHSRNDPFYVHKKAASRISSHLLRMVFEVLEWNLETGKSRHLAPKRPHPKNPTRLPKSALYIIQVRFGRSAFPPHNDVPSQYLPNATTISQLNQSQDGAGSSVITSTSLKDAGSRPLLRSRLQLPKMVGR